MALEDALISSAGGDFVATLAAVLAIFIMAICVLLVRWIMVTIPAQMEKDRLAMCAEMEKDRLATCDEIKGMINTLHEHDRQAKEIKDTASRIEIELKSRPCQLR